MECSRGPRPPSLSTEASVCPAGERPFVCLICLSAFTTKANCERHLKVHTDTLNGESALPGVPAGTALSHSPPAQPEDRDPPPSPWVSPPALPAAILPAQSHTAFPAGVCHSCGFISTTRDILYSHLVTNHMICQPGSKGEVFSPGPALPAAKPLTPGGYRGATATVGRGLPPHAEPGVATKGSGPKGLRLRGGRRENGASIPVPGMLG